MQPTYMARQMLCIAIKHVKIKLNNSSVNSRLCVLGEPHIWGGGGNLMHSYL